MKYVFALIASFIFTFSFPQAMIDNNFNYLYNSRSDILITMRPVVSKDSITVFYFAKTEKGNPTTYLLKWEKRNSYTDSTSTVISYDTLSLVNNKPWIGQWKFSKPDSAWLLVVEAKIVNSGKRVFFIQLIEPNYPVNGYLKKENEVQFNQFVYSNEQYLVNGSKPGKPIFFTYYKEKFQRPLPPFAETGLNVPEFLLPDSTFTVPGGKIIGPLKREGLYLAQEDTLSNMGFSFLVKNFPFPKYNKLAELKDPLLFVTTQNENDQIEQSGENKVKFDKIILEITEDKELAQKFIRNYFRRVEYANNVFSSFKEGWQTDKGMMYIIYGPPDEVKLSEGREIWKYFGSIREEFYFVKTGSVYYPENYVLIRDTKYKASWYSTVDLWRKSRF